MGHASLNLIINSMLYDHPPSFHTMQGGQSHYTHRSGRNGLDEPATANTFYGLGGPTQVSFSCVGGIQVRPILPERHYMLSRTGSLLDNFIIFLATPRPTSHRKRFNIPVKCLRKFSRRSELQLFAFEVTNSKGKR